MSTLARDTPQNQPIERPGSLKDLAYREIKNLLLTGRLERDQLYSAQYFADMLGVSRTPVREALLQLASEGYLDCLEVRGFKIKEFSSKQIQDVVQTRQVIEAHVVKTLADRLSAEDLEQLKQNLQVMIRHAKNGDTLAFLEADKEFHMTLVRRTENSLLISIMENIRDLIALLGLKALQHEGRCEQVIREHKSILKALYRKDRKRAVQAMSRHLNATERQLVGKSEPGA